MQKLQLWADFIQRTRNYFIKADYLEVFTDSIVPAGAFEGTIDIIKVISKDWEKELHTSPEIEMKRLIANYKTSIFQVAKCYRDDPDTGVHLKEFFMLEFYRMGVDYRTTIRETKDFFQSFSSSPLNYRDVEVIPLVKEKTGLDLNELMDRDVFAKAIQAKELCPVSNIDGWTDLFFKLMLDYVEPGLDPDVPTLVYNYPAPLAALAQLSPDKKHAERFEIYWKGMEICNGCTELDDISEMKRRYKEESEIRRAQGKAIHPFPERLAESIAHFPPCSGVAVGLERLFACIHGKDAIFT